MNREIKFKQPIYFNGELKEFHYWGFLKNTNDFVSPQCSNQEAFKNSVQFTGLKDKNGKEIYEGDIVKNSEGSVFKIIFNVNAWFVRRCIDKGNSEYKLGGDYIVDYLFDEVIGNIFENPELLKQ